MLWITLQSSCWSEEKTSTCTKLKWHQHLFCAENQIFANISTCTVYQVIDFPGSAPVYTQLIYSWFCDRYIPYARFYHGSQSNHVSVYIIIQLLIGMCNRKGYKTPFCRPGHIYTGISWESIAFDSSWALWAIVNCSFKMAAKQLQKVLNNLYIDLIYDLIVMLNSLLVELLVGFMMRTRTLQLMRIREKLL